MKINIFSDNVAPYRINWANELGKQNEVSFAYLKAKDTERNNNWLVKESDKVQLIKLPSLIVRNRSLSLHVIKYLKANPCDIVIFDGYGPIPNVLGMLYCKRHKIKYYVNIDGVRIGHKESWLAKRIKKAIFNSYAYCLCGSETSANEVKKYGITDERICIHNFTSLKEAEILNSPPTQQQKDEKKKELGFNALPTLIAVGRFLPLKQFDMVIKAFAKYDDKYQLVIIGEGDEEKNYRALIQNLKLKNVTIVKFLPIEQLKDYYYMADALVLSSNSEVWGMVMNEGMGYGALPIIASTRCAGAYSVIEQGVNGYRFDYDNQALLSEYIGKVLGSTKKEEMRESSLKIIKNFTVENTVKKHLDFFNTNKD